jgi:hypothetical protein
VVKCGGDTYDQHGEPRVRQVGSDDHVTRQTYKKSGSVYLQETVTLTEDRPNLKNPNVRQFMWWNAEGYVRP